MISSDLNPGSILSDKEINRYYRQVILKEIGIEGQERLKRASVLVIGAGGLGCPVLQYLVAGGIGKIGIVDSDIIEETNFQRQVLYGYEDTGKPKAITAKQKLEKLNPFAEIISFDTRLDVSNINIISESFDILVGCPDNFHTRLLIDDICKIKHKPFVFGAVSQFTGQVSVFHYKHDSGYRQLFFPDVQEIEENTDPLAKGIIGALTGIIGSVQANEVIKIILSQGKVLEGILFVFDILNMEANFYKI